MYTMGASLATRANLNSQLSEREWATTIVGSSGKSKWLFRRRVARESNRLETMLGQARTVLQAMGELHNGSQLKRGTRVHVPGVIGRRKRSLPFRHHPNSWTIKGAIRLAFNIVGSREHHAKRAAENRWTIEQPGDDLRHR